MKRLTAAFAMHVSAKDLHSFSLCCSCEHHLVVIEQANRIKECIKQVRDICIYKVSNKSFSMDCNGRNV